MPTRQRHLLLIYSRLCGDRRLFLAAATAAPTPQKFDTNPLRVDRQTLWDNKYALCAETEVLLLLLLA